MGKIYDRLQKQLQVEEHREDAEDCIKIYKIGRASCRERVCQYV